VNAYIYRRVSSAAQARAAADRGKPADAGGPDGVGLDMQERACRSLCELRGWHVAGVFTDEGVPGVTPPAKRKGLMALVEAYRADPGDKTLVVYDLKRLARRSRIALDLLDPNGPWGLSMASATQAIDTTTPLGRAMITVLAAFAELDWEEIRERNIAMQRSAKARGARWGAAKMYERREKDPVTGKVTYVVVPELVEHVRHVQDRYRSGDYSLIELAKWLNDHGVASPLGKRWHLETVRRAVHTTLPHSCADDPARCSSEHPL